jgi:hypothetical protein
MDRNAPDYYIETTDRGCYDAELFVRSVLLRTVVGAAYLQSIDAKNNGNNNDWGERGVKYIPLLKSSGSSSSSGASINGAITLPIIADNDDHTVINKKISDAHATILQLIQSTLPQVTNLSSLLNQSFTPIIMPCITPRFVPTCTSEMMSSLSALSIKYGLPIQSHLSESINEIKWVAELYPDCTNYASVYKKYGLLNENVYMAHCVHCDETERKLLRSCKTGMLLE